MSALVLTPEEKSSRLQLLRSQVSFLDGSEKSENYSLSEESVRIPKGALVELTGPGRYAFVAHFLARHQQTRAAWVEHELTAYPPGLLQRGVGQSQITFIESAEHTAWVLTQALQSQVFPILIGCDLDLNEKAQRKFQLLAERAQCTFFRLSGRWQPSWIPTLSLKIEGLAAGEFRIQTLRRRGSV